MGSAALDPEFLPACLCDRVIEGARRRDVVRLHGAIVAALEIHSPTAAVDQIFSPALAALRHGRSGAAAERAEAAIAAHMHAWTRAGAILELGSTRGYCA